MKIKFNYADPYNDVGTFLICETLSYLPESIQEAIINNKEAEFVLTVNGHEVNFLHIIEYHLSTIEYRVLEKAKSLLKEKTDSIYSQLQSIENLTDILLDRLEKTV